MRPAALAGLPEPLAEEFQGHVPNRCNQEGRHGFCPPSGSLPSRKQQACAGSRDRWGDRNAKEERLNRVRASPSTRALVAALALASVSEPAFADRHCAPALEAYWRARTFLLQENRPCADAIRLSTPDFHEAAAQARICGFMSLHDRLNSLFFGDAPAGEEGCRARVERILDFGPELKEIVEAYHY